MQTAEIFPFPIREQETPLTTCACGCPDFNIENMKIYCSDRNCGKELKLDEVKK